MRWLQSVSNRLRNLFRKDAVERETDQELRFHLERQVAVHVAAGMPPEEARRAALLEFGGVEQFKEDCREARGVNRIESLLADLRYGFRSLPKSPGFTIVSVLTPALGIGANTAIFSMVNALLLHPYNFRNLDSLVRVWEHRGIDEGYDARYIAPADAEDLRSSNGVFEGLTTYNYQSFGLGVERDVQPILGCRVSANFFDVLAVTPAVGRLFSPAEEQPGADQVAILSYGSWQRRFGGDLRLLGKSISLDSRVYTIVGIMPKDFDYPVPVELWVPLALTPAEKADRAQLSLNALARLKLGVTVSQAGAALANFSHRLAQEYPKTNAGRAFSDADNADAARVVLISRGMASRFWPKTDALGHRIKLGAQDSTEQWLTIVGVVGDVRQNWWNPVTRPVIYKPFAQAPQRSMNLLLRTASNPTG
jgi:putative ABC transport system permease protein